MEIFKNPCKNCIIQINCSECCEEFYSTCDYLEKIINNRISKYKIGKLKMPPLSPSEVTELINLYPKIKKDTVVMYYFQVSIKLTDRWEYIHCQNL